MNDGAACCGSVAADHVAPCILRFALRTWDRQSSRAPLLFFGLLLAAACDGRDAAGDAAAPDLAAEVEDSRAGLCPEASLSLWEGELGIEGACGSVSFQFRHEVRIGDEWIAAGECDVKPGGLSCPIGDAGTAVIGLAPHEDFWSGQPWDGDVFVSFTAAREVEVGGLALVGTGTVEGAEAWLSNGYQSWSQSGMVALGKPATEAELAEALAAKGDVEVLREGDELSWWWTLVGSGEASFFAGAVTADRFKPWTQVWRRNDGSIGIRLVSGGTGERVKLAPGEAVTSERWMLNAGKEPNALLEQYGRALPSRAREIRPPVPAGWNSWYELWDGVDEEAVRANAALAKDLLAPHLPDGHGPPRIVIDDGWQVAWGEWVPNERFPSGLDGLAADLKADGFEVGIWMAPLLVDEDSALVSEHPDWFVEGLFYPHALNGKMRVLDVTNPAAAAHLAGFISTVVSWGYDLLKIDFLFAGSWEGKRAAAVTGLEAYHKALEIIREAAGEGTLLTAVGAPPLPSLPYVEAWRLGGDIAFSATPLAWPFIANQARSLSVRWPLCLAVLCDADPVLLRDLPREQVESGGWVVAFAGGALFLSDDLRHLPEERWSWGLDPDRAALALGGLPAVPESPFPDSPSARLANVLSELLGELTGQPEHHVVPLIWRLPDGRRVAFNASVEEVVVDSIAVPPAATRVLP
jgi:hypothetical protein